MDIEEVRKAKRKLEVDLRVRIAEFMEQTGCRPEVEVRYEALRRMGSGVTDYMPVIEVQAFVTP